jgi:protein AbiQ
LGGEREMEKLKFYQVDKDYLAYLKRFENKVPDYEYSENEKFYCGVVVEINNYRYFAPVSSFAKKQKTNILIEHKGQVLGSIRFSFMIPVPESLLTKVDFSELEEPYKSLVIKEYTYCKNNQEKIRKKAVSIYSKGLNKNSFIGQQCCDFKLLEEKHDEYLQLLNESETVKKEVQGLKEIAFGLEDKQGSIKSTQDDSI